MTAAQDYPFAMPTVVEPPPEWAELRSGCPVARVRLGTGDEALLITRYDDVRGLLADPRFTRQLSSPDAAKIGDSEGGGIFNESSAAVNLTTGDGHGRWRRMMSRSFTAKRAATLKPRMAEIVGGLVDDMVAAGPPADLTAAIGFPLPVQVICELLGVPVEHRDKFSHWSDAMLNLTRFRQDELDRAAGEFYGFMAAHVRAKRRDPGDDLISELAAIVDADDGRLSEAELIATAQGLLVAGHETTATMIGKMMALLLSDRLRWERLLADRALVPAAVEESLRFDPNGGFGLPRYISEEITLGGETVPAGSTVICSLPSANRDDKVFDHADEMVLDRKPNPHVSFGAGPHSCLGQSLARTELQTVLEVLLDRLPGLSLAVPAAELRRREGLVVGGVDELPVTW